jgi:thiol-disulfide isomerase/thioredoxin
MADRRGGFPGLRPVLIAAIAGLATGAVAVYVTGTPSGNITQTSGAPASAPPSGAAADIEACAASGERAKAVAADAQGEVAAMLPASPPQSLAGLALNDPSGTRTTLGSMAGKILLVNLWATWCAPCRAEMPALDALQEEMGDRSFEVVAINVDTGDDAKPKRFLSETGVTSLAYYRENTLTLFNDLKKRGLALGLPVTLLVDRDGCLLANMNGPAEWASDDARRLVRSALGR